ncbi:conserved hypothetical protein [Nostocoides japonicum T1-X7]|uniref:Cobalamin-independent methionine synthase MetE C-terminal/archaeal domain-containing protein n=1 Tax=Nostocoides japonicum T1-X7 TaxID=1194083 RepID=A0A077LTW0_9MICO|nr:methionine synthase [Tetrasphaera japonica]CCH77098.1 conserved hypothetical protein [Tetrasphaera japonica T1-X7]
MTLASGVGSLPGTDIREALAEVRDTFAGADLPYLPELPGRGPGSDLVGRTGGLLVELPLDLQPSGWRLVDRPGRDARRTASLWRQDLDELAEAFEGYAGSLKLQVCGPWTMASVLQLGRGERVLADPGATRDLVESLAEGVRAHLADVARLLPQATLVVQLDEPGLSAVIEGRLPTASGYGRIPAVDRQRLADGIRTVLAAAGDRPALVHCCAADVPIAVLHSAGAPALSVDTSLLSRSAWDEVATVVESGTRLYAGLLPTSGPLDRAAAVDRFLAAWREVGLPASRLADLVVTPACGLAGLTPQGARDVQRVVRDTARQLADIAEEES